MVRALGSEAYKCTVSRNSSLGLKIPFDSRIPRSLNVSNQFVNDASSVNRQLNAGSPNGANPPCRNVVPSCEFEQLSLSSRGNRYDDARCGFGEKRRNVRKRGRATCGDRGYVNLNTETGPDAALRQGDRQPTLGAI